MEKNIPTRLNLLLLKQRVRTMENGLRLLEGKREALVREFFQMASSAMRARENLRGKMQKAQNSLTVSAACFGREALLSAAFATRRDLALDIAEKNVWGVRYPDIQFYTAVRSAEARGYAATGTSPQLDESILRFEEVIDQIFQTVSVEMKLKRIGQEIKKVTRRINALKAFILPSAAASVRKIKDSLDEREHEESFRIRRFKKKLGV